MNLFIAYALGLATRSIYATLKLMCQILYATAYDSYHAIHRAREQGFTRGQILRALHPFVWRTLSSNASLYFSGSVRLL